MSDEPDPLSVACPTCAAHPGDPCKHEQDEADEFHKARVVLAGYTPPGI